MQWEGVVIFPNLTAPRQPGVCTITSTPTSPSPNPACRCIRTFTHMCSHSHTLGQRPPMRPWPWAAPCCPPLSWSSERVASGAWRGTFLLVPLLCTSLQGPEPERLRWEWAWAAARGTSSGAGERPGPESPPSPLGRPGRGATRSIPEFSAAFFLFVAY